MVTTESFIGELFDGLDGYVYAPVLDDGKWIQRFFHWPEQSEDLFSWIRTSAENCDCYVSPSLFASTRASKASFKVAQYVWVDLDSDPPQWLSEPGHGLLTRANALHPSIVVHSSGIENWESKQHAYWRVQPITDYPVLEAYNRGITHSLSADRSGWDCTQVLRVPGTRNLKYANRPSVTADLWDRIPRYVLEDFPFHVQPLKDKPKKHGMGGVDALGNPASEKTLESILLKYKIPAKIISYFQSDVIPDDRSSALMHIGHLCAENQISQEDTFSILYHFDNKWGKYNDREQRDAHLDRIVALAFGRKEQHSGARGFVDFNLAAASQIDWAFTNLMPRNGHLVLTGPSGVGKTLFSLNASIRFSVGLPFFEINPPKPQRIVYFSFEMGASELGIFTTALQNSHTGDNIPFDRVNQNLFIAATGEPLYIDSEEGRAEFESYIDELRPNGIFIDTLGSFVATGLSDDNKIRQISDYLEDVRRRYNCYTWIVHHQRKPPEQKSKSESLADVYGSQYIVARATAVLGLFPRGETKGNLKLTYLKSRYSSVAGHVDMYRDSSLLYKVGTMTNGIVPVTVEIGDKTATIGTQEDFTRLVGF